MASASNFLRKGRTIWKAWALLAMLVAIGIFMLMFLRGASTSNQGLGRECFSYTDQQVMDFLKSKQQNFAHHFTLRRNFVGSKVYLFPDGNPTNHSVVIVSAHGIEVVTTPGRIVYLGVADNIVAWSDDLRTGVRFSNGYALKLPEHALFDVDPSGEFFLIGEKPSSTWIGRTETPQERICLSSNILGTRLFKGGNKLYIGGQSFERASGQNGIKQAAACIIADVHTNGFELRQTLHFPWAAGVVDVAPTGERILLREAGEFSPKWIAYDPESKTKRSAGRASGWCAFLQSDLLR